MPRHPYVLLWRLLRQSSRNRELRFATLCSALAVILGIVGLGLYAAYSVDSRTTGHLWWKETTTIPLEDRIIYLRLAAFTWAFAVLSIVGAGTFLLQYRLGGDEREELRLQSIRAEAHRQWLLSPQGLAYTALMNGQAEFALTLRVVPPLYVDAVHQIQQIGWTLAERVTYSNVKTSHVTPTPGGGHEVVRTVVEDAIFRFTRTPVG